MKNQLITITLCIATFTSGISSQEFTIESPKVTDWGSWGEMELCPTGTFVFGFRLKVEPYQTVISDDCALNAVELLCIAPTVKRDLWTPLVKSNYTGFYTRSFATIVSKMGHRGDWGPLVECNDPEFVTGFHVRQENDQGWYADDTAANDFKVICSGGTSLEAGNGTPYGEWSPEIKCPRGHYVCGIQTQVEDPQGTDDTTLNNVKLACCPQAIIKEIA